MTLSIQIERCVKG